MGGKIRVNPDCSCPDPRASVTFVSTGYQGTVYRHEVCGRYFAGPTYGVDPVGKQEADA